MELPGISSALPFNISRVFNVFVALFSDFFAYRRVLFDRSKSNWLMGRTLPHRCIPGSQKNKTKRKEDLRVPFSPFRGTRRI
jgi:hypothetical protein